MFLCNLNMTAWDFCNMDAGLLDSLPFSNLSVLQAVQAEKQGRSFLLVFVLFFYCCDWIFKLHISLSFSGFPIFPMTVCTCPSVFSELPSSFHFLLPCEYNSKTVCRKQMTDLSMISRSSHVLLTTGWLSGQTLHSPHKDWGRFYCQWYKVEISTLTKEQFCNRLDLILKSFIFISFLSPVFKFWRKRQILLTRLIFISLSFYFLFYSVVIVQKLIIYVNCGQIVVQCAERFMYLAFICISYQFFLI